MRLRVYLDTSVLSALCDNRNPERREETRRFWARREEFDLGTCQLAKEELGRTPSPSLRKELLEFLESVRVFSLSEDAKELARRYVRAGAFSPVLIDDAMHVAAAVAGQYDVILSWNFKHLVNRRRRAMVNEVNVLASVRTIEILAPPEL